MNVKKTIVFLLLFVLFLGSARNFILNPDGVSWFANTLCVIVSAVSIALSGRPGMDVAFFNILVLALCVVSLAIAWGQWFVLETGTVEATIVPVISGLAWRFRPKSLPNLSGDS